MFGRFLGHYAKRTPQSHPKSLRRASAHCPDSCRLASPHAKKGVDDISGRGKYDEIQAYTQNAALLWLVPTCKVSHAAHDLLGSMCHWLKPWLGCDLPFFLSRNRTFPGPA